MTAPALRTVLDALQQIAPLELAAEWDNVGLLVEAPVAVPVRRILMTIDLTEPVFEEALEMRADLIVAYHPPIFDSFRRLVMSDPKQRIILRAVAARMAIYSPHTAMDAAPGGVNDWLAGGLGQGIRRGLERPSGSILVHPRPGDDLADVPVVGQGREVLLDRPVALNAIVRRVKRHLGLVRVRLATAGRHGEGQPIERVALCAGAGAELILDTNADLLLTGEMRHHDILAAVANDQSVLLCDHTNTERGYLPTLERRLRQALDGEVAIRLSRRDADPLEIT